MPALKIPHRWRAAFWSLLTLIALVAATALLGLVAERGIRSALEQRTSLLTRQLGERLQACVITRVQMLSAMKREWDLGALDSPGAYRARADSLITTFPGLLAINRVGPDGVIRFVYPEEGNQDALGRRVTAKEHSSQTFLDALHTNRPQLSAPGELFQGGRGVAVYVPFADRGDGAGALNGVFRTEPLVQACLSGDGPQGHSLQVEDGAVSLYTKELEPEATRHRQSLALPMLNRIWTVQVVPSAALVTAALRPVRLLLGSGLALSLGLSLVLFGLLQGRSRARAAERRSLEERRLLASLVESAHDFVVVATLEGEVQYLNATARKLMGVESLPLKNPVPLIHPDDLHIYRAHSERCAQTGWSQCELRVINQATGEPIPMEFHGFLIDDGSGNKLRANLGRDLQERRKLEGQLQQAQKMEALGRLAGGVAHDFNNLLTVIQTASSLLHRDPENPERDVLLSEIEEAGQRAAGLTRELLALGRGRAELSPVDLGEVLNRLRPLLIRLVRSNIITEVRTPPGPVPILGNQVQLEQILVNLVMNAVDAMPHGGQLTVELAVEEDQAVLTVLDSGTGISPEVAARIFEPFFTTKEPGRGTGLGLATVYGHVNKMKGTIQLDSSEGQGARFVVRFPLRTEARQATMATGQRAPPLPELLPRNILLVENNLGVRVSIARMLRDAGFQVEEAATGQEAVALLAPERARLPQLVLSDVVMPHLGGVELVRWIREHHPRLPVLLMSGHPAESLEEAEITRLGVPLLQKPLDEAALLQAMRQAVATLPGSPDTQPPSSEPPPPGTGPYSVKRQPGY